ncbi:MAG: FtsX-like permease family protein, partial [Leifsonia flava]
VLALVVGVAVAVSSGVLLTTIRSGIDDAAVTAVGADLRVKGTPLTTEQVEAIGAVPGVADAAAVSGANSALIDVDGRRTNTSIIVVDTEALGRVQGDAPGAIPVGAALRADGDSVPIVASGATTAAVGTSTDATLDGEPITIVATVDGSTALSTRANWAVVDSRFADRVGVVNPVTHVMLLGLEPGADLEATRAAVQAVAGDAATVDTPADSAAVLASTPAAAGLQYALLIAIAVTALLSALTIAMTLVLGGPARARILVLLRMLGGGRRDARSLAVWEIAPMAVVALVFGAALGIGLPLVILAGVDLRGFTGGRLQPALSVDPLLTLALVLGFAVVTALCTFIALFASGRARASSILRTVEA